MPAGRTFVRRYDQPTWPPPQRLHVILRSWMQVVCFVLPTIAIPELPVCARALTTFGPAMCANPKNRSTPLNRTALNNRLATIDWNNRSGGRTGALAAEEEYGGGDFLDVDKSPRWLVEKKVLL